MNIINQDTKSELINKNMLTYLLTYSVDLDRKLTIPTELPPLVGAVSANFCG
jgi:hypothetical protein